MRHERTDASRSLSHLGSESQKDAVSPEAQGGTGRARPRAGTRLRGGASTAFTNGNGGEGERLSRAQTRIELTTGVLQSLQ